MEEKAAFVIFVLVAMFTPGPNTVSSANYAMLYGFGETQRYRLGIFTGLGLMMLVCAFLSTTVIELLPQLQTYLRYAGAAYISYLALGMLKTSYEISDSGEMTLRYQFTRGMFLQVLNVKVLVLGITIYSTYLARRVDSVFTLLLSALLLAACSLCATSLWAFAGNYIARFAGRRWVRLALNISLSLLLLYSAYRLAGF